RRFAALIERAGAAEDPRDRAALLADALALWRGPPPAGFAGALFAPAGVARRGGARRAAGGRQGATPRAPGGAQPPPRTGWGLVARHPLRERLRAAHMLALYRAGRQAEAVKSYTELRRELADNLGLDPGPGPAALYQAIIEQDPALQGVPAPPTLAARPRTN